MDNAFLKLCEHAIKNNMKQQGHDNLWA